MNRENLSKLEQVVKQKSRELCFSIIRSKHSGPIVSMLREEWHLSVHIDSSLVQRLFLQMAIHVGSESISMLFFPSPSIIKGDNVSWYIRLANTANRYLYRGNALGRFWVDENNFDFVYEVCLKENMLECDIEETARQLFEIPYSHYVDLHIPLVMLAGDIWGEDTAINYFEELREKGQVKNSDYGLI